MEGKFEIEKTKREYQEIYKLYKKYNNHVISYQSRRKNMSSEQKKPGF